MNNDCCPKTEVAVTISALERCNLHSIYEARPYCKLHAAAREKIVGWYHTGPRIREADLDVSALLGSYCENPLLVICEVEVRLRLRSFCQSCRALPAPRQCAVACIAAAVGAVGRNCGGLIWCACALQPKDLGLPTTAYYTTDEIREVGLLYMTVAAITNAHAVRSVRLWQPALMA